jgi:predicted PurR-regulated permease PerM
MIAVMNTLLTAGGLIALELQPLVQLSFLVLFCSFVPIAGVFVSTIPIGIIALAE